MACSIGDGVWNGAGDVTTPFRERGMGRDAVGMGGKQRGIKRLDGGLAGARRLNFRKMNPKGTQGTRDFRTTHWSLVADAADSRAPGAEAALAEICRAYWAPLYVFARTQGVEAEEYAAMAGAGLLLFGAWRRRRQRSVRVR